MRDGLPAEQGDKAAQRAKVPRRYFDIQKQSQPVLIEGAAMTFRDIALTVLELEIDEFHWVLMEAVQAESEECLGYRPVDSSMRGLRTYTEALIEGASALRTLQGLAPFGQRPPVGRTFKPADTAAAPTPPPAEPGTSGASAPRPPQDSDLASMFTGYQPR